MYKGLIMKVNKKHLFVMTDELGMKKIKNNNKYKIGESIYFFEEDVMVEKSKRNLGISFRNVALAASLVLVLLLGGYSYMVNNAVYTVVSLDINPSVELELNKKDIVIGIEAINEDGSEIIIDGMLGMSIEDALDLLIANAIGDEYLKPDGWALISVVEKWNDNDDTDSKLEGLFASEKYVSYNIALLEGTKEELKQARKDGVTVGMGLLRKAQNELNTQNAGEDDQLTVQSFFNNGANWENEGFLNSASIILTPEWQEWKETKGKGENGPNFNSDDENGKADENGTDPDSDDENGKANENANENANVKGKKDDVTGNDADEEDEDEDEEE